MLESFACALVQMYGCQHNGLTPTREVRSCTPAMPALAQVEVDRTACRRAMLLPLYGEVGPLYGEVGRMYGIAYGHCGGGIFSAVPCLQREL